MSTAVHLAIATDDLPPILLSGDPTAIAYDAVHGVLYIAEGKSGAVLALDGWQRTKIAVIDGAGVLGGDRIAGLAVASDGTVFATRPGHGVAGAVFRIGDGSVDAIDTMPPRWIRAGIAYDGASGAVFATQYLEGPAGPTEGVVVRVRVDSGETTAVACGFEQPVAVVKLGPTLAIADAALGVVYRVEMVDDHAVYCAPLAEDIDRPVALCAAGISSLLVATYDVTHHLGAVRQIWLDGRQRTLASGPWEPCGIAASEDLAYVALRGARKVIVVPR